MSRERIPHEVDDAIIEENARTPEIAAFAKTLNALLISQGIHQEEMARVIGVSTGSISYYWNGEKEPSGSSEIKLKYIGIKPGKLNSCIFGSKMPVDPGTGAISLECPRTHLMDKAGSIRERFGKCLPAHNTNFNFCHVKPTSMLGCKMPFKAFC